MRRLGVAQPHCRVASIAKRTEATTTTAPPLDGADETEATSPKLDGEDEPEFCGYGVRTSPISSNADTNSFPEFRVKATVSSLPAAGTSMGGPRSPTPPTANWSWSTTISPPEVPITPPEYGAANETSDYEVFDTLLCEHRTPDAKPSSVGQHKSISRSRARKLLTYAKVHTTKSLISRFIKIIMSTARCSKWWKLY